MGKCSISFQAPHTCPSSDMAITSTNMYVSCRERGSVMTDMLNEREMRDIAEACKEHVQLVEQRSMDVVVVPPGWIHCVVNLQLCMKLAYDRCIEDDLPQVSLTHRMINVPWFRQASAQDYTGCLIMCMKKLIDELNAVSLEP